MIWSCEKLSGNLDSSCVKNAESMSGKRERESWGCWPELAHDRSRMFS